MTTFVKMKAAKRWLLASPEKIPHYANRTRRNGKLDTPEDNALLVTYGEAKSALAKRGPGWRLGFALGPDAIGGYWQGIDFDAIEDNLLTVLILPLPGYVETSPSGHGLHALGYGRSFRPLGPNGSGIEAYAYGRYFTVTENVIRDGGIVCVADHVENELARHHKSLSTAVISSKITGAKKSGVVIQASPRTIADLRSALNYMRADDYNLWIEIGHALKSLGDVGRGLWMDWSSTSEKFDPQEASRKWESFDPQLTGYQAVFAKAQASEWVNPASNLASIDRLSKGAAQPTSSRKLVFQSLDNVQMRAVDWLWAGWIPKGYITLFAGETGAGKSTVLADVTARVTTGSAWPGEPLDAQRAPGRVLWLGSEDGIEEMTVPRLVACAADRSKILEISGVEVDGLRSTFSMQDDLAAVAQWLEFCRDEDAPFEMLVIDPVTSYLPGQKLRKVDLNDAGQLRSILEPWLRLAQEFNIAIVCVTHFAKDTTRAMLHRVIGSAAFAQTCRSLCAVIERPIVDGQANSEHAKALVQVKVNLPEHPGGAWQFRTIKVEVGTDLRSGKPIYATRPEWERLDSGLTPQTAFGGARGPVSKIAPTFRSQLHAYFSALDSDQLISVAEARSKAVGEFGVPESWWDRHSGKFLEKHNVGGKWMCRPIQRANKTL